METSYIAMIVLAVLFSSASLFLAWFLGRLSRLWKKIGEGEVERIDFTPPSAPKFLEPFLGSYFTRGHFVVHFTNGEKCTCLGLMPRELTLGKKIRVSQNMLCEIHVQNL